MPRGPYRPETFERVRLVNITERRDGRFWVTVKSRGERVQQSFSSSGEAVSWRDEQRRQLGMKAADDASAFLRLPPWRPKVEDRIVIRIKIRPRRG